MNNYLAGAGSTGVSPASRREAEIQNFCFAFGECTSPFLHAEMIEKMLLAGKHVICEKPLAGYFGLPGDATPIGARVAKKGEKMSEDNDSVIHSEERDKNLLVVVAVEGYAMKHKMQAKDVLQIFLEHNITNSIREHYNCLHTQDIYETVDFAEDILRQSGVVV